MMTVQVVPDRFKNQQEAQAAKAKVSPSFRHVRRPTRGIVLKDETFATLRVVTGNGGSIPLIDAGSRFVDKDGMPLTVNGKRSTDVYSNFLLQSVQEDRMEKQQILETFGEPYIFLFGQRARVITCSGVLLNTFDFNWEAEWQANYDQYLRGTRCVENDARVFLSYDQTLVSGYIIGSAWTKNTEQPYFVNFQFQIFVTNYTNFSDIGNPDATPPAARLSSVPIEDLTDSYLQNFRPNLLPPNPPVSSVDQSLVDSIQQTGLSSLNQAWNSISTVVNNALSQAGDAVSGTTIRIPYGWEGATVFDNDPRVTNVDVKFNTSLWYGFFSDNDDEYVGAGSQYGDSVNAAGPVNVQFDDPDAALQYDQNMVNAARQVWKDNGFDVPDSSLGPVSSFLVGQNMGLLVAGASTSWQTQSIGGTAAATGELGLITGSNGAASMSRTVNLNDLAPGSGRSGVPGVPL